MKELWMNMKWGDCAWKWNQMTVNENKIEGSGSAWKWKKMTLHENEMNDSDWEWNEMSVQEHEMKGLCLKIECVDCAWKWNEMKMKWDYEQLENVPIKIDLQLSYYLCHLFIFFLACIKTGIFNTANIRYTAYRNKTITHNVIF